MNLSKMSPDNGSLQPHHLKQRRKEMTLPRLTAEAAIYKTSCTYRSRSTAGTVRDVTLSAFPLPAGSYQNSCINCDIAAFGVGVPLSFLYCQCYDFSGNLHDTTLLTPGTCFAGDIANCNGQLTCGAC